MYEVTQWYIYRAADKSSPTLHYRLSNCEGNTPTGALLMFKARVTYNVKIFSIVSTFFHLASFVHAALLL